MPPAAPVWPRPPPDPASIAAGTTGEENPPLPGGAPGAGSSCAQCSERESAGDQGGSPAGGGAVPRNVPERTRPYALAGSSFLGVAGRLLCHRWLWMVMASTLADSVLAGMWLNCFLSELYL